MDYFSNQRAELHRVANSARQKQIDVLKDRGFEFTFIPLDTIDLTLALDNLREAWRDFENREYVQASVKANEAIAEATASELRLRHEEVNL